MFDTLPIELDGPEDMKPGDLVFVSAIYNNPKCKCSINTLDNNYVISISSCLAKQQKHNIVHVEVWLGDEHKTVGARWQKGVVEIHNSYQYISKSYHSMKYHFHSIDTWLKGVCVSHCLEHPWKQSKRALPGKKSIFCEQQQQADPKEIECEEISDGESDETLQQYLPHDPINKPDESSRDQSSSTSSDDSLSGILLTYQTPSRTVVL